MNKFWIVLVMLLPMNLVTSDIVNAEDALVRIEIFTEIVSKRTWNIPGTFDKTYTWQFENQKYIALMAIDEQSYNRIRNNKKKRMYNHRHFAPMVYKGVESLKELIRELNRVIPQSWSEERKVNFVLAFVQAVVYENDQTTGYDEYYKYPTETLAESRGDCEDTSMLFACILSGLGFELALFDLPRHLAVGVKGNFTGWRVSYKNDNYYFCETTNRSYTLGMMSKRYRNVNVTVIPITPTPVPPEQGRPRTVQPPPKSPAPPSSERAFQDGIDLYLKARYNEAIKSLQLALAGFSNPEKRAEVYIYLGAAEYAFEEGRTSIAEARAKARFQKALRENPNQELPWPDHPKFAPWFKEVRRESIGELTISTSLPETEIWIYGNGIDRRVVVAGTNPINLRLFKGSYTIKGIYAGRSKEQTINIIPDIRKELKIERELPPSVDDIPPKIELVDPSRTADVDQKIQIVAEVTDNISVKSVYLFYAFSRSGTEPSKYDRIALTSVLDRYFGDIPSQREAGYIWYYLTATDTEGNEGKTKKRNLEIKPSRRETPPEQQPPTIEFLSPPRVAHINQRILVKARVTDDAAVKSVYLFYRFSHSRISEPSEYDWIALTKTVLDMYTGYIPSQNKAGYVWYYLGATDTEGSQSKSAKRLLEIELGTQDTSKPSPFPNRSKAPKHQGIWVNYAWSNNVFQDRASVFDLNSGDSISLTYLSEGKNHQTFAAQFDFSNQNPMNINSIFQWAPALEESPIVFTALGGVAGYLSDRFSNESIYITPILGVGLKLYPLDRVSIDAICSFKLPSNFDTTYLYHYEIGTRIYINDLLNLKLGYSQFHLGSGTIKRMQIGLGFTF